MAWLRYTRHPYSHHINLEDHCDLTTPRYRLDSFGKRRFAHATPYLWNTLPISIKCAKSIDIFKKCSKTHLFIFIIIVVVVVVIIIIRQPNQPLCTQRRTIRTTNDDDY